MLKLFLGSLLVGAIAFAAQEPTPTDPVPTTTTSAPVRVAPNSPQTTTTTTTTMPPTTTTTTTTTTLPEKRQMVRLDAYKHPRWIDLARQIGWPTDQLAHLDYVIHRESRGKPDVWNRDDPMSGSRGLTQVNGFWCKRTQYNRHDAGFLGKAGVLDSCDDLFDPETNLAAALTMWEYGVREHGCGWGPWRTKGWNPCRMG